MIKSPKLYFYDVGLASYLCGIQNVEQMAIHPMRGHLFEGYVISELMKARLNRGLVSNLYFWRDQPGLEIDLLMDQGTFLQPVEIKSGKTLAEDFFKSLKSWCQMAGPLAKNPTLVYGGDESQDRSFAQVLSWRDLKNLNVT
jgi:predicted AAA+ superfamily ATPase